MSKIRNIGVTSDSEQNSSVYAAEAASETEVTAADESAAETEAAADISGAADMADAAAGAYEGAAAEKPKAADPPVLIYIGPSVFRTELISGRVFITHGKKLDEIIPDELRNFPLARMMFVTPDELSAARAKIHDPGTALGNAYKNLSER